MDNLLGRQTNYTVHTPVYEGPLDLLLDLIERAELDVTTVSLAMVTDQYLVYIHGLEQARADEISAFLVIAAKLLQIKSEALLPRPPVHEPGEENIGEDLVRQLKLYKRFQGNRRMVNGKTRTGTENLPARRSAAESGTQARFIGTHIECFGRRG